LGLAIPIGAAIHNYSKLLSDNQIFANKFVMYKKSIGRCGRFMWGSVPV